MREIPPLHILCLRVVGSSSCSAETTFARDENGKPSTASRLLRSFHQRPALITEQAQTTNEEENKGDNGDTSKKSTAQLPPIKRTPCIGDGSARRPNANEVDLQHPFAACKLITGPGNPPTFFMQHGNPASDCMQSFIDALVELGRMDDGRFGLHFFDEWKANILIAATGSSEIPVAVADAPSTKKRRRGASSPAQNSIKLTNTTKPILGSLSLHNCSVAIETVGAMVESKMGPYLAVLDLSGINGLTDEMLEQLLPTCSQLQRLSVKNCRRVTNRGLTTIGQCQSSTLLSLDVGGVFNVSVNHLLEIAPQLDKLEELHASGLGWTDTTIEKLSELNSTWKALSFSFSLQLSQIALRQALLPIAETLQSIAMAFCENVVDNALLGMMGRNLPHVKYLDLRGNPSLTTLTGWYDGRVSADLPGAQPLTVLGRYSGLSEANVEETRQVHPFESNGLLVILDGTGTGLGIMDVLSQT
jgi:hypothetical protein